MRRIAGATLLLAASLVLLAPTARAEAFYFGGSYTQSDLKLDVGGSSFKDDADGWKGFVGLNFIDYFGLELAYYDLGTFNPLVQSNELSGYSLAARGIWPLGEHFELSARLGVTRWDVRTNSSIKEDGTDVTYGIGAAGIIGKYVEIRAEYEILQLDIQSADADVDIISLGFAIRF